MNKKLLANLKEHPAPKDKLPVEYIMTPSIEEIEGEKVLFVSLFSQKNVKDKADYKIFMITNDYVTQKLLEDGSYKWSSSSLENLIGWWCYGAIKGACDTLEERELIGKFLNIKCIKAEDEYKAIDEFQKNIMQAKLNAKHEKIKKKIDAVMEKVPELPKDFKKWVNCGPFGFSRYIYYKREGKKIISFCTECKKEFTIPESKQTQKNLKHNNNGTCPVCGKKIVYKAIGKTTTLEDRTKFAIVQKYENGLIVRYFYGVKNYREHYKNPSLMYWEDIREIYSFSNGVIKFKKYEYASFCQTNEYRWCDDSGKIETPKAYFYTRNLKSVVKDTKWKYSCLYEFAKEVKYLYADTFLREYVKHPAIEYFIKCGLFKLLNENLSRVYTPFWTGINFEGKNIIEVLGISKQLFQQLQRLNLGESGLQFFKDISKDGKALTDEQIKWIINNLESFYDFKIMLKYSTSEKIINYLKKQASNDYDIKNAITDWSDYTTQCLQLKFDLNNTFILYPKNLREKHDEYTIMNKSKGLKKFNKKVLTAYEKNNKLYAYSDKNYLIRPSMDVNEIVLEGHKQRHCVGGLGYVSGVAEGKIAIMLIRKTNEPDNPFYTLELDLKTLSIRQCRGFKNCSTTDEVQKFIERWKKIKLTIERLKKVV